MGKLIGFGKIGDRRSSPRLFFESQRLTPLGFTPGMRLRATTDAAGGIIIEPGDGNYTVGKRRHAGSIRPVLDMNSSTILDSLIGFDEYRLVGSFQSCRVTPSMRAFFACRHGRKKQTLDVMDLFCGGGTMSQALHGNPDFRVSVGVEIEPKFADVWASTHPDATLVQGDVTSMLPQELPVCDGITAGIPCTDHSNLGRAKKGLVGDQAENDGQFGGLYHQVLEIVKWQQPLFCVFENVVNYGNSKAGAALRSWFIAMGYQWSEIVLEPTSEWEEPSNRRRWLGVATRTTTPFTLTPPGKAFVGSLASYLDDPSTADAEECARIANTIEGLRRHNARHAAQGHGFGFTEIDGDSKCCPTLVRSYHKINCGPFVRTQFGLRLLRQHEMEKLHGCSVPTEHFATACEIIGQGVQTRVFREVFRQLGAFLRDAQFSGSL